MTGGGLATRREGIDARKHGAADGTAERFQSALFEVGWAAGVELGEVVTFDGVACVVRVQHRGSDGGSEQVLSHPGGGFFQRLTECAFETALHEAAHGLLSADAAQALDVSAQSGKASRHAEAGLGAGQSHLVCHFKTCLRFRGCHQGQSGSGAEGHACADHARHLGHHSADGGGDGVALAVHGEGFLRGGAEVGSLVGGELGDQRIGNAACHGVCQHPTGNPAVFLAEIAHRGLHIPQRLKRFSQQIHRAGDQGIAGRGHGTLAFFPLGRRGDKSLLLFPLVNGSDEALRFRFSFVSRCDESHGGLFLDAHRAVAVHIAGARLERLPFILRLDCHRLSRPRSRSRCGLRRQRFVKRPFGQHLAGF